MCLKVSVNVGRIIFACTYILVLFVIVFLYKYQEEIMKPISDVPICLRKEQKLLQYVQLGGHTSIIIYWLMMLSVLKNDAQ